MSDRRPLVSRFAVVARAFMACALVVCAGALQAQQDAALIARRDSLRARAEALRVEVARLEAIERDSGLAADVRAGGLHLRTTDTLRAVAAAALADADADARRMLGAEADLLANHLQFTLREHRAPYRWTYSRSGGPSAVEADGRISRVSLEGTLDDRDLLGVSLDYPVDRAELASNALMIVERAIAHRLPASIAAWLNYRVPLRPDPPGFWPELYRTLATADAAAVRRCVAGDRTSCRTAFALDSVPVDRVAAWYDASDYPALARNAGDPLQRSGMYRSVARDEQDDCTVRNHLDTCRRMLALLPVEAFRIPMPETARGSLTRLALEMGGARAVERLRTSTDTSVGQQLAGAAGAPVDSVLDRWMQRVIAARPSSPLPSAGFVLASLACIAVCVTWAVRGQPWK